MYTTKMSVGGAGGETARRFWETRVQEEVGGRDGSPIWTDIHSTIKDRRRCRSQASSHSASSHSASRSDTPTSVSSDRTTPSSSPSSLSGTTSRAMLEALDLLPSPPRHPEMLSGPTRSKSEDFLSTASRRTATTSRRFYTTCYLEPKPIPVRFSSTVYIRLGSTKRSYTEQIHLQTRLVPQRFSEGMSTTRSELGKVYTATLMIPCEASRHFSLEPQQNDAVKMTKMTNGTHSMVFTKEEFL